MINELYNKTIGLKLCLYAVDKKLSPDSSGVYLVFNIVNYKYYIGSTRNFKDRFLIHLDELKYRKHCNYKLQTDWNKFGDKAFIFIPLEITNYLNLLIREQFWMDKTNPPYNIKKIASRSSFDNRKSVISKEESLNLPY